jgi:hypothetical protein
VKVNSEQGEPWRNESNPGSWQQNNWSSFGESVSTIVFPHEQNDSVYVVERPVVTVELSKDAVGCPT